MGRGIGYWLRSLSLLMFLLLWLLLLLLPLLLWLMMMVVMTMLMMLMCCAHPLPMLDTVLDPLLSSPEEKGSSTRDKEVSRRIWICSRSLTS